MRSFHRYFPRCSSAPLFVALFVLACCRLAHADDGLSSLVIPFGEDLTATSYTLKAKSCSLGFLYAVCGINDAVTVGTSPWLLGTYNTLNVLGRFRVGAPDARKADAIQVGYLKSYSPPLKYVGSGHINPYEMELFWLYYIRSYVITSDLTVHLNVQAMYYLDDQWPLSIRRPWLDRGPVQFNFSLLNEIHLIGGFYVNAEVGILGFTQQHPEYLLGLSFEYRLQAWLFHAGFSQSGTTEAYDSALYRFDYQNYLLQQSQGFYGPLQSSSAEYDYAVHPEFAIQYYF